MRGLRILETRRARALRRDAPAAERLVWRHLRNRQLDGWKFTRQEPIGPYVVDFAVARRGAASRWATHSTAEELESDSRRTAFLQTEGYREIRFTNEQVYENVDAALELEEISRELAGAG